MLESHSWGLQAGLNSREGSYVWYKSTPIVREGRIPKASHPLHETLQLTSNSGMDTLQSSSSSEHRLSSSYYCIAENSFEEEIFHKLYSLWPTCKSFLHKILGVPYPPIDIYNWFSILRKRSAHFLLIRESFLPQKFPAIRYSVPPWTLRDLHCV